MEIIEELQRDVVEGLSAKFKQSRDFDAIKEVLGKQHIFRVKICDKDFDDILINSSTDTRELQQSEYPSLSSVIQSITPDDAWLNTTRNSDRGLSGKTVRKYRDEFLQTNSKPEKIFIVDRIDYPQMNKNGLFYVRDGMHHLVAYGLATQMNGNAFPIIGYYCSNRETM